jgi:hypothetical protein
VVELFHNAVGFCRRVADELSRNAVDAEARRVIRSLLITSGSPLLSGAVSSAYLANRFLSLTPFEGLLSVGCARQMVVDTRLRGQKNT